VGNQFATCKGEKCGAVAAPGTPLLRRWVLTELEHISLGASLDFVAARPAQEAVLASSHILNNLAP
jgi:hypothetical protein